MICIHALGGRYHSLRIGEPTGFNPFQLEPNNSNKYYIVDLIKLLVGDPFTARHLEMVEIAVDAVFKLSPSNRRLGAILNFLDTTDDNGIAARLRQWTDTHRNGWVFDNPTDDVTFGEVTAFDVTEFLDHPEIRTPIVSYILHRLMYLIDGQPIVIWMDEFWKLLEHDYFREDFLQNKYKTIRKENGCLVLSTQSPADALNSPISSTLIEQS